MNPLTMPLAASPDPYARFGGAMRDFEEPVAPRVSILAIASLILGILCLPGFGLLAMILGGAAILLITRARGRLTGMGIAAAGCIIGLIASVIWVVISVGAVGAMQQGSVAMRPMLVPAQQALTAMQSGDIQTARQNFSPTLNAGVKDQEVKDFVAAYTTDLGAFKSSPQSLGDYIRAWFTLGSQMGNQNQGMQQQYPNVFPIPAEFDKGWGLLMVQMPPNWSGSKIGAATPPPNMPMENLGIYVPGKQVIWLTPMVVPTAPTSPSPDDASAEDDGAQPGADAGAGDGEPGSDGKPGDAGNTDKKP